MNFIDEHTKEVLISETEIQAIVVRLANEINRDHTGEEIVAIAVLKGSLPFFADLTRKFQMPVQFVDVIEASSYEGTESSGQIKIKKDISVNISGKNVFLIEDIVDTGLTMSRLIPLLRSRKPKSLKLVTFLDKPSRRKAEIKPDYVGKEIPNLFVVGYGMDYEGRYRTLPDIRIYRP